MRARTIVGRAALGALTLVAATTGSAMAHPSTRAVAGAQRLSRHAIRLSSGWKSYDEAPSEALVSPVRVLDVTGEVSNPQGLLGHGDGQTTLTYPIGGAAPSMVLDFGRDVGGFPTFDVSAASLTAIGTEYSETLRNLGNDGAASVALLQSGADARSDTLPVSGAGTVTSSALQGGERYERITLTLPGSVTLRGAKIRFTALRETPALMAGHFLSSDPLLNRIWYAGAYTLNLNQLTPGTPVADGAVNQSYLLLDGAKRDRAVWSGDHQIADLTDLYVSDPRYARDSDALLLDHPATTADFLVPAVGVMSQPGPLPGACSPNPVLNVCVTWSASYSLDVVPAVLQYLQYTGDTGLVREYWPAIERDMAWAAQQVDGNGLFTTNSSDGDDWNLETLTGEVTYNSVLYVEALQAASKLASAIGQPAEAADWNTASKRVAAAINANLWNPQTGAYDASDSLRGTVAQDANVVAILAGVADPARAKSIIAVLGHQLATPYGPAAVGLPAGPYTRDISPFMGSFQVLADFAAGDEPVALALIRQEWGYMIGHDPGGVDWERIQPDGIPAAGALADSSAHAWSTGPTAALSAYVLGVKPATNGYAHWSVAPEPGDLRFAQGVVPTPHGAITTAWSRAPGNRSFTLTVRAPRGTSGTVTVPLLGHNRLIARGGRIVWTGTRAAHGARAHRIGGSIVFSQGAGTTTYAWHA